ncbi:TSUP family transporter [Streptomyces sp. Je 1-4]|uniref:TSUP family transporter n=1 Tax=Streptomyces TaxID=1883 RepID=UPI0021DA2635|nr:MULTISPECIES: TSUP family transporter [unclassified Streptomyces]UYB41917.1 TSUP family transporter [Streptomyces sp. Je 1-4]UZQ38187.1 TSUP family transporter [Streptomyces sp. Je 1-4] [Streptomyces sp. Je 1-4 4N24]UZQ45604.1 TSUP family transporter [Streptomyces sp. Je 1-4] [Streptomyces sp. Je 1-4 4N24_ara]
MSVLVALTVLPCGLLIGLLLGALGGGGSVLAVPALVYLLGQSPHEATAGALVVVTVGAVTGLLCHGRAGRVRWAAGAAFGALGTAGSYLGSRWSAALDPTVLMAAFAGLLLVVAAMLLTRGLRERRAAEGVRPLRDPAMSSPLRDAPEAVPLRHPADTVSLRDAPEIMPLREPAETVSLPESAETMSVPDPGETAPLPASADPLSSQEPADPLSSQEPAEKPFSQEPTERPSSQGPAEPHPPQDPAETVPLRGTAGPASSGDRGGAARRMPLRPARFVVTASAVGLLTGFFGVGGGFVVVPALTLVLGLEMPVAIGTSLLVILINSLTALGTRAGTGALDWPLLAGFAACAALGSHLGNRLTNRLRPQVLATAFACLVTVLAVTMAATALPRLW